VGLRFVLRRLAVLAVTAFVVLSLNFALFRAAPGDAVSYIARVPNASPALRADLERQFGLDRSLVAQYAAYLRELASGNLGVSFADRRPVAENLLRLLRNTVPMVLLGTVIAIALGVAIGVLAAWRRGSPVDQLSVGASLVLYSLPTQWLGMLLIGWSGGLLPTGGMRDPFLIDAGPLARALDTLEHMLLPSATLALVLFGQYVLIVRSTMLETLGEDYVLTARAKGLPDRLVVRRHALRNAMLPATTLIGLSLGTVVAGSILTEVVFSWPGIGRAVYEAVLARDYPMLQGAFLALTLAVLVCNFVADLVLLRLDPRIRS